MSKVVVMDHPLIQHKIGIIRKKETGTKDFRQNISDHFRCKIKIIPAPFVENADGTADGAGDHIGNFFLCMPVRPGIRCSFCNIMMEHSQHFFKQIIAMRCA